MADQYAGPFATLGTLTSTAYDATAKTAINAAIDSIRSLVLATPGQSPAHPDFQKIPYEVAVKIDAELAALKAAITAHA